MTRQHLDDILSLLKEDISTLEEASGKSSREVEGIVTVVESSKVRTDTIVANE